MKSFHKQFNTRNLPVLKGLEKDCDSNLKALWEDAAIPVAETEPGDFIIIAKGKSMTCPEISEGDCVIFQDVLEFSNNNIYAIFKNEKIIFTSYYKDIHGKDLAVFVPFNMDDGLTFTDINAENVVVLGELCGVLV